MTTRRGSDKPVTRRRARGEVRRLRLPQFLDLDSTWYQRWYFELRFEEELERALRYGQTTSLVMLRLVDIGDATSERRGRLHDVLAWLANERLRITDMPGVIESGEYALFLPQTDRAGAEVVAARISAELEDFGPSIGIASFPEDGFSVEDLLDAARPGGPRPSATVIPFPVERLRNREALPAPDDKPAQ